MSLFPQCTELDNFRLSLHVSFLERLWASGGKDYVYSSVKMTAIVVRDAGR